MFKKFSDVELNKLSKIVTVKKVSATDNIFYENEEATAMYVIEYGSVSITKKGTDDNQKVNTLGPGMHFGELPFVDGLKRSATAEASENAGLLEIPYEELKKLLVEDVNMAKDFYSALAHFLAVRLRKLTTDLSYTREHNLKHF